MPRAITELSDAELIAVATGSPSLEELSDDELAKLAVNQGYWQEPEANAAVVAKKKRDRAPEVERILPPLPTDQELQTMSAEQIEARFNAHNLGRVALTKGGRVGDVAAQVLTPIGGSVAGSAAGGLPGAIAGGAAGGAAGDTLAQKRQYLRGERDDFAVGEMVAGAIGGAVPMGAAVAGKPVQMAGRRALQGAGIAIGADATGQVIDTGSVDLPRLAATGALGVLFGGAAGAAESAIVRKQVLRAVRETPEFRGFEGSDRELIDALRTKVNAKPEPVDVTPPAEPTTAPAPAEVPAAPPAVSAQAEFEARAGMTPSPTSATTIPSQAASHEVTNAAPTDTTSAAVGGGQSAPVSSQAGAEPAAPPPLSELSDEELIAVARSAGAEITAPATPVESPAPTPDGVSGSAAGQSAPVGAIENAGGQEPHGVTESLLDSKHEASSRRLIADQRRKIRAMVNQAKQLQEVNPRRAARVQTEIVAERERLARMIANKRTGPRPKLGPMADGEEDLLASIANVVGHLSTRPPAGKEINGADYDDLASALSVGPARMLRAVAGQQPDKAMIDLEDFGYNFGGDIKQFAAAISQASANRDAVERSVTKRLYEGKFGAALFDNASNSRLPHLIPTEPLNADTLEVGQSFKVRGELAIVEGVNPDSGDITLRAGSVFTIPAGSQIWPDKGVVFPAAAAIDLGNNPFEPNAPYWNKGLSASNRYAELTQKLTSGTINPMERLELEAFEAGAGQQYVPGSMDPAVVQADKARAAANAAQQAKMQVQAAAEKRLLAPDLQSQQNLFGPTIGDTGSLFEPSQLELTYDVPRATGTDRRRAIAPSDIAAVVGGLSRDRGRADFGVDPAVYLADPINNAGPLGAALKEHGRVSSIVADFAAGALPSWSPVGKLIRSAADVGALMAPLRNPHVESFKVVVLDTMKRVVHAEVAHIGTIATTHATLQSVLRIVAKTGGKRVILSHNHPSGDPTPSTADWSVHERLTERLKAQGIEVVDDVVTNGHAAYSMTRNMLVELEHDTLAPWEKLPRRNLARLSPGLVARLAGELRQSNPDSSFVLYLTQRKALTAVEQVPANLGPLELLPIIEAGVAREGAASVVLTARSITPLHVAVIERQLQGTAELLDVVTTELGSFFEKQLLDNGLRPVARPQNLAGHLEEGPSEYGDHDPASPIVVRAAGRGKESPYAKVRLAHLPNIKIVQMPELVRLTRELTGKIPELRKLRSAHGHFDPNNVTVRLDPRIFRDQLSAAKTLAHEIGHVNDFLDDGMLKRGNLLGRVRSLRMFLQNTFGGAGVTNKELRAELLDLGQWWKPFNPASVPAWFKSYRESAVELYADALSVLFNSPAELKGRAPKFWAEFFAHLDKKPEAKATLLETWDFLNKPHLQTLERRSEDIRKMFVAGDEIFLRKAAEREARYATFRGWNDRLRQELFDTFDPLVRKAAKLERGGTKIPRAYNPRLVFDEHPLADNANYRMLQRLWEMVVKPVEAKGFTLHELGEYLFLQRVLNEKFLPEISTVGRAELANPLGMTPDTARLGLLRMRLQAGFPRMQRLEAAAAKFHDIIFEQIKEAVKVGAYSRKIFAEVLEPNRRTYATFAVLDYLQDYVPAGLRMQEGTFKEIANPFTATLLKSITLNRLIQVQRSKRAAVQFLQSFDPANIAAAPRSFDGKRFHVRPPQDKDKGLLDLLEDGKPTGFYVDPAVAEMFEKMPGPMVSAVTTVLNWPFRNLVYPLIIKYNPAFQLVLSPLKDLRRTLVNVPKGRGALYVGEYIRNYLTFLGLPPTEAGAAVRAYLRGERNDIIAEMIARQAIGTPLDNFAVDLTRGDKMEQLLRDYGMLPAEQQRGALRTILAPVRAIVKRLEFAGLTFEMLPKVSTYRMLTRDLGWDPHEAAYFARNNVGVPNIYKKGRHVQVADVFTPFFKIFVNGTRADLDLMTQPKTAGGWWFRWAASDGIWTIMQAAAAAGLLGAGLKELYDGVSEYNKSNYNVLPLGSLEGGQYGKRIAYVRFPRDETHRWMSGLLYQGMMAAAGQASKPGVQSVAGFGTDQMPGLNPILKIGAAWKDFIEGENPMDGFRGKPVLSNSEWLAGGWPAYKAMLGFTLQNTGVTNFVRWDPASATTAEMTLSAVPGLNRFVQTTDAGYRERQEQQQQAESRQQAQIRVAMPENVQNLIGEYYYLVSIKTELRTIEQTQRLMLMKSWRTRIYQPIEDVAGAEVSFGRRPDPTMLKSLEAVSKGFERGR